MKLIMDLRLTTRELQVTEEALENWLEHCEDDKHTGHAYVITVNNALLAIRETLSKAND